MDDRSRTVFGRTLSGAAVVVALISLGVLAVLGRWDFLVDSFGLHNVVGAIGLGLIALVALRSQPRNGAVWAFAWAAFFSALQTAGVATIALYERADPALAEPGVSPADLPLGAAIARQTMAWTWVPAVFLIITLGLLLFPDGRPPSSRWRWVGWVSVALIAMASVALASVHGPSSTVPYDGIEDTAGYAIGVLALPLLLIASGLSVTSLVVRYRRSSGVVRQQIRWIAWGGAILVISMVWVLVGQGMEGDSGGGIAALIALAGEVLLILSIAIAITRYRLYEIDVVISRTVTYGALALFITAVYVAIVVGVGTLVGQGDEPNLALAIVATAVVALLFQPVRSRVQRWVNRLVYGDRASPYAVLSELTARLSEADSNEQALKRLAELIESGTGAKEAIVWLRVGDHFRPEATSGEAPQVDPSNGDAHPFMFGDTLVTELTAVPGDAAEPIHHGGELLGVLSIRKGKADPVTRADHDLLRDVAAGSGLLLRNIQLNAELADRAEELRLSRRRLVAAQDSERRRLERNLHDGAQQQVVALKVKLGLAKTLAEREDVDPIAEAVADLAEDTQRAVDGMRAAARGIYPPLLEAEGLRAALIALAREASIGVDIDADGIGRYPPEIEATVYFSVLEAIDQSSSGGRVTVGEDEGALTFTIQGADGEAGLAAVADRMDALEGTLKVESSPSGETVVTGRLPARALEPS
jgi:signal transduction histidine kinase